MPAPAPPKGKSLQEISRFLSIIPEFADEIFSGTNSTPRVGQQFQDRRFLAEGYGRSLTDRDLSEPYLLMLSPEGRVLAEGPWEDGQVSSLLGPAAP